VGRVGSVCPVTYGERYRARWRATFLVFVALGALLIGAQAVGHVAASPSKILIVALDMMVGGVADGLLFGSLVCTFVAVPRGKRR
jgi:hypothetical protein